MTTIIHNIIQWWWLCVGHDDCSLKEIVWGQLLPCADIRTISWYIDSNIFDQNICCWKHLPPDICIYHPIPIVLNVRTPKTTIRNTKFSRKSQGAWLIQKWKKSLRNLSEKTKVGEVRPRCRPVVDWGEGGRLVVGLHHFPGNTQPAPSSQHPPLTLGICWVYWIFGIFRKKSKTFQEEIQNKKFLQQFAGTQQPPRSPFVRVSTSDFGRLNHLWIFGLYTCSWLNMLVVQELDMSWIYILDIHPLCCQVYPIFGWCMIHDENIVFLWLMSMLVQYIAYIWYLDKAWFLIIEYELVAVGENVLAILRSGMQQQQQQQE